MSGLMDNFTIAVIVGDAFVLLVFLGMLVTDMKTKTEKQVIQMNPVKPAGKRSV
jgi:hypothetical protein